MPVPNLYELKKKQLNNPNRIKLNVKNIRIRLSDREMKAIDNLSNKTGMTKSDIHRLCITHYLHCDRTEPSHNHINKQFLSAFPTEKSYTQDNNNI